MPCPCLARPRMALPCHCMPCPFLALACPGIAMHGPCIAPWHVFLSSPCLAPLFTFYLACARLQSLFSIFLDLPFMSLPMLCVALPSLWRPCVRRSMPCHACAFPRLSVPVLPPCSYVWNAHLIACVHVARVPGLDSPFPCPALVCM